jgi:homoserine dehydrogenase
MKQIGIGLGGLGTVGTGVYKHLKQNRRLLKRGTGAPTKVAKRLALRSVKLRRSKPRFRVLRHLCWNMLDSSLDDRETFWTAAAISPKDIDQSPNGV